VIAFFNVVTILFLFFVLSQKKCDKFEINFCFVTESVTKLIFVFILSQENRCAKMFIVGGEWLKNMHFGK
jgi:HKD family nuclease